MKYGIQETTVVCGLIVPEAMQHWNAGIALFNAGRYFEAHEALEDAWREAPIHGARRRHLQGLVQLAVAFHHQSTGNWQGAGSVLERALRNLSGAEESFPELNLDALRTSLAPWREHLASARSGMQRPTPDLPQLRVRLQM